MKKLLFLLILVPVLALCACNPSSNAEKADGVSQRLSEIDAFKADAAAQQTPEPSSLASELSFRGVPFGSTMEEVLVLETQPVLEKYTNALDFEYTEMFSYSMMPAYWFNEQSLFYCGGYYMLSDEYEQITANLYQTLAVQYGNPNLSGYYNYEDTEPLDPAEAKDILNNGQAYYYAWFSDGELDIELFTELALAQSSEDHPAYDIYVTYTDYTYYDLEID